MANYFASYGYGNPIPAYTKNGYAGGLPLAGFQGFTPVQYVQQDEIAQTPRVDYSVRNVIQPVPAPAENDDEVHYYYGPDGRRLPGPPAGHGCRQCDVALHHFVREPEPPPLPNFFVIMGLMEFGRITMIDQNRTTPGVTHIPSQVVDEIARVYSHVESSQVQITCDQGRYLVQTSYHPGPGFVRQQQLQSGQNVPPPPPPPPRQDFPVRVEDSYIMQKFFDTYLNEPVLKKQRESRNQGMTPRSKRGSQTYR
ncbi:uncharacterized protein LOC141900316 [Tubulanus polymorphus]|uniref:uncharacterized protein LOC141900316 n=1 Tax=Tubulanus polymorphus TaxID=672921 RepID=UPI003DA1FC76